MPQGRYRWSQRNSESLRDPSASQMRKWVSRSVVTAPYVGLERAPAPVPATPRSIDRPDRRRVHEAASCSLGDDALSLPTWSPHSAGPAAGPFAQGPLPLQLPLRQANETTAYGLPTRSLASCVQCTTCQHSGQERRTEKVSGTVSQPNPIVAASCQR